MNVFKVLICPAFSVQHRVATASGDGRCSARTEPDGAHWRPAVLSAPDRRPARAAGSLTAPLGIGGEKETGRR